MLNKGIVQVLKTWLKGLVAVALFNLEECKDMGTEFMSERAGNRKLNMALACEVAQNLGGNKKNSDLIVCIIAIIHFLGAQSC